MAKGTGIVNQLKKVIAESVEPLAKEMHMPTPKMEEERISLEMQRDVESFTKRCKEGAQFCITTIEELAEKDSSINLSAIKENLIKGTEKADTQEKAEHFAMQLLNGKSWKELLGLKETTVQALSKSANHIFNSKRFKEAVSAFTFLTTLDAKDFSFWIKLGQSAQKTNDMPVAINAFAMASMCDESSIWPHLYASETFEAAKDSSSALKALEEAKRRYDKLGTKNPEIEKTLTTRFAQLKR